MNLVALLMAQVLRLTDPGLAPPSSAMPDTSRYHLTEFTDAIDRGDAFRYLLADFNHAIDGAFRYRLADFSHALDHAFRYHLADFNHAVDKAFRYRLVELADSIARFDTFRYRLTEFSAAVERDVERCICMTTRLSLATHKSEVLLVTECSCGK